MNCQHKELAAGRWGRKPFIEQMANIGSEVERALNWKAKNNESYSRKASERALELLDLTLDSAKDLSCLKEVARAREAVADYLFGKNEYKSTADSLKKYFFAFSCASRKDY
jgi:hypothetical protein